jgi:hypothetical protein
VTENYSIQKQTYLKEENRERKFRSYGNIRIPLTLYSTVVNVYPANVEYMVSC